MSTEDVDCPEEGAAMTQMHSSPTFKKFLSHKSSDGGLARKPLGDSELLYFIDEFLFLGEVRDFMKARDSFIRIGLTLGTEEFDVLIPYCLEVLQFSQQPVRIDTLLCLMHISFGCSFGNLPAPMTAMAMRRNSEALARHGAMQVFVRCLAFLLAQDADTSQEEGVVEREFRLVFNCMYMHLLLNDHNAVFVHSLKCPASKRSSCLLYIVFEATKICADREKIPIKKTVLLLFRTLRCVLDVPDHVLTPNPDAVVTKPEEEKTEDLKPRIREFQAFTALVMHEASVRNKYNSKVNPVAITEALEIIAEYRDDFLKTHVFHPAEICFMRDRPFLHDAYDRYMEFKREGALAPRRRPKRRKSAARMRNASDFKDTLAHEAVASLGKLADSSDPGSQNGCTEGDGTHSEASSELASSQTSFTNVGASSSCTDETFLAAPVSRQRTVPPLYANKLNSPESWNEFGHYCQESTETPEETFHQLYVSIFPRLNDTCVLLLRLLLTSCSNVENYPGVVDLTRERAATSLPEEEGVSALHETALGQPSNASDGGGDADSTAVNASETGGETSARTSAEATEAARHREIIAATVSGVLLILLRQAKRNSLEQFACLAQIVTDANGVLVALKFLNQDLMTVMDTKDQSLQSVPPNVEGGPNPDQPQPNWLICAALRLVRVLYILCKDSPERVRKFLIQYKAPFILKRLQRIENEQMQRLVLKLLKTQVRYLPRKWKQTNMKAISSIYSMGRINPLDDWLLNESLGDPTTEGPPPMDIRNANAKYNAAVLERNTHSRPKTTFDVQGSVQAGIKQTDGFFASGSDSETLNAGNRLGSAVSARTSVLSLVSLTQDLGYAKMFPEYVPSGCEEDFAIKTTAHFSV